jgi:hypothetical protein
MARPAKRNKIANVDGSGSLSGKQAAIGKRKSHLREQVAFLDTHQMFV